MGAVTTSAGCGGDELALMGDRCKNQKGPQDREEKDVRIKGNMGRKWFMNRTYYIKTFIN
jgi:hypothetical protein